MITSHTIGQLPTDADERTRIVNHLADLIANATSADFGDKIWWEVKLPYELVHRILRQSERSRAEMAAMGTQGTDVQEVVCALCGVRGAHPLRYCVSATQAEGKKE